MGGLVVNGISSRGELIARLETNQDIKECEYFCNQEYHNQEGNQCGSIAFCGNPEDPLKLCYIYSKILTGSENVEPSGPNNHENCVSYYKKCTSTGDLQRYIYIYIYI